MDLLVGNFYRFLSKNTLKSGALVFKLLESSDGVYKGEVYSYNTPTKMEVLFTKSNDFFYLNGTDLYGLIYPEPLVRLDPPTESQLIQDTKWYYFSDETYKWELIEITFVRSGVVFFRYDNKILDTKLGECYFAIGSLMSILIQPEKVFIPKKYNNWRFDNKSGNTKFYPESKAKTDLDRLFILK